MKNAQKKGLMIIAVLAIVPVFFLTNCKVGLGTAVDTKAPSVTITYPPTNSIIRDTFVMSGTAEDETGIASVSVVLTKLPSSSGVKSAPISGSVDASGKKWTASINAKNAAAGTYAIADGKYEAQVTVTDTVGRKSSSTAVYTIDNTRPIVVVSQPATRGLSNAWEFGTELNFMGMQYDDNISGKFYINFYDEDGDPVTSYTGSNVLTDWTLDIENEDNAFVELKNRMDDPKVPEKYWYTISVEDSAFEYKNPSESLATGKTGNRSLHYYVWSDISKTIALGEEAPKINTLYKLEARLPLSHDEKLPLLLSKKEELEKLEIPVTIEQKESIVDTAAHFTIEPDNVNPLIKGDGLTPSADADDDKSLINQLGLSGTLRFEIEKNKDKVEIDTKTMRYKLDQRNGSLWNQGTWTSIKETDLRIGDATIIYTYDTPATAAVYRLELFVQDTLEHRARNHFWYFTINAQAPEILISPASNYVLPQVAGNKFNLKITAYDDGSTAHLTIQDGEEDPIPGFISLVPDPENISEEIPGRYKFVWNIELPANPKDGGNVFYTFVVTDGKWTNKLAKKYTTDKSPPVMASLTSPSLTGTPPRALVSSTSVSVVAKAGIDSNINVMDITQARLLVTASSTAPSADDPLYDPLWQNANVSSDGEGTINGSLVFPGTPPSEGMYYVWYRFADRTYDEVTNTLGPVTKMFDLEYDKANPSLAINSLPENTVTYLQSPSHTLKGSVSDTYGIKSFTYSINEQDPILLGSFDGSQKDWPEFNSTGVTITLPAGDNTIVFTLTDKAGKETQTTRKVFVDTQHPIIDITSINPSIETVPIAPATEAYLINGIVTVKGTFSDDDKINSYTIAPQEQIDNGIVTISTQNSSSFEVKIDTTKMAKDAVLSSVFNLSAQDRSGKTAAVTGMNLASYKVDQESDRPVITDAKFNIDVKTNDGVNKDTNLFSASQELTVTISDDDGIDRIDFYINGSATPVTVSGGNKTGFTLKQPLSALVLNENTYNDIRMVIVDNGLGKTSSTATGIFDVTFKIGYENKSTSVTVTNEDSLGTIKVDPMYGEYIDLGQLTGNMTISGTAAGSFSIQDIIIASLSKKGSGNAVSTTVTAAVPSGNPAWSFGLTKPAASVAEIFSLTATDNFGRDVIKRFSYIFDLDKPAISISASNQFFMTASGAGVSGTALDAVSDVKQSGMDSVEYTIVPGKDTLYPATPITNDKWKTLSIPNASGWTNAKITDFNTLADGWYTIHFRSKDKSGNYSDPVSQSYYSDSKAPVITTAKDGSSSESSSWYEKGTFYLEGTIDEETKDDPAGGMKTWNYSMYYKANTADPYGTTPESGHENVDMTPITTGNSWTIENTSGANGKYKYVITATDFAGYSTVITREIFIDTTPPILAVSNLASGNVISAADYTYRGTLTDTPAGPKNVYYQFTQNATPAAPGTDPVAAGYTSVSAMTGSWAISKNNIEGTVAGTGENEGNLHEGQWYLHLAADDTAGNLTTGLTIPFVVDLNEPTVAETTINTISPYTATVDKTGLFNSSIIITDTHALKNLTVIQKRNGAEAVTLRNIDYTTDKTQTIALNNLPHSDAVNTSVVVDGSKDGLYTYDITVTDIAGKPKTITRSVRFDTQAPTVSVTSPTADGWYSNASFSANGLVSDTGSGAKNLHYAITQSADAPSSITDYTAVATANSWTITKTVESGLTADAGNLHEGTWYLHLRAEDNVGNITAVESASTTKFNLDRGNPSVTETVDGTKGVGTGTAVPKTALFSLNLAAGDTHALKSLTVKQKKNGVDELTVYEETALSEISYPYVLSGLPFTSVGPNVSADVDGSDDGLYTYDITVTDIAGKTSSITRSVRFDTKAPVVTIISPAANAWIGSTALNLSGNAADDSGVSAVRYNLQPGSPGSAPANPATWTAFGSPTNLSASISGAGEGVNTLWLYAVDIHGNNAVTNHVFKVDTLVPSLSITGDSIRYIRTTDTNINLSGTASDTAELDKVTISVGSYAQTINAPLIDNSWSTAPTVDNFTANTANIVEITAYDKYGRTKTEKVTVYYDTQAPVTTVTTVNQLLDFGGHKNAVNGTVTISGTLSDNTGIAGYRYTLSRSGYADKTTTVTGSAANFTISLNTLSAAVLDFDGDTFADDDFELTVLVESYDASGNVSNTGTTPASSAAFTLYVDQDSDKPVVAYSNLTADGTAQNNLYDKTSNNKILGTLTDDDGLLNVDILIDSVQTTVFNAAALNNTTSRSFTYEVGGLAEGAHTVAFVLTDKNNKIVTTATENFAVDAANPVITVTTTPNTYIKASTPVTVTGTASDGNGFASIQNVEDTADVTLTTGTLATKGSNVEWSYTFTSHAATGTHSRLFRAKDAFNKESTVSYSYLVDSSIPTVTPLWPAQHVDTHIYIDGTKPFALSGTAEDTGGSGLSKVYYALTAGAASAAPATEPFNAEWKEMAGTAEWNISITTAVNGPYTLHVIAQDKAGNFSAVNAKTVYIDQTSPSLTDIVVSTNTVFNGNFTITGNASDPDGYLLQKVTAHYTGLLTPVELPLTPLELPLTGEAWSYTVPALALAEDNYDLTITAYDKSGKKGEYKTSFIVDRTDPSVEFSNINTTGDTSLTDSSPKVYIYLSDANGLHETATVEFKKKNGSNYEPPAGHTPKTISITADSKSHNSTIDMAAELTDKLTDGIWQAVVIATDIAGNDISATSADFRVDRNNPVVSKPAIYTTTGNVQITNGFVTKDVNYTVKGTASDDGGIDSVKVQLKFNNTIIKFGTDDYKTAAVTGNNWTVDIGALFNATGSYDLIAIATDLAGRSSEKELALISDSVAPVIEFTSPFPDTPGAQKANLIGEVVISGKSTDDAIYTTQYAVGGELSGDVVKQFKSNNTINWIPFESNYIWNATVNTTDFANQEFALQDETILTIWTLPVHVKAVDEAGNTAYETLQIKIDTDRDKPVVEFGNPKNNATVGGQFMINGSATDIEGNAPGEIFDVYMQIEVVGATYTSNVITGFTGSDVTGGKDASGAAATKYFTKIGDDPAAWYLVNGQAAWDFILNKAGELNKEELKSVGVTFDAEQNLPENNTITKLIVRVKARDTKLKAAGIFGYPKEIELTLQSGAPNIIEQSMPKPNEYVSGSVPLNFNVEDEDIDSVSIDINGTVTWIYKTGTPDKGFSVTRTTADGKDKWEITKSLNTVGLPASTTIKITAKDTAALGSESKTSVDTRTIYIDNTAPVFVEQRTGDDTNFPHGYYVEGELSRPDYKDNKDKKQISMVGSSAKLRGKITEVGSGIDKIILYFTQAESVDADGHEVVENDQSFFTMGQSGQSAVTITETISIGGEDKPFPVAKLEDIELGKTGGIPQRYIVIDKGEGGFDDDLALGDNDGYKEHLPLDGEWYVNTDSLNLKDGHYTVHCVVRDNAGNLAYTRDTMFVHNTPPSIDSVTLYTDVDGNGTFDEAYKDTVPLSKEFVVRSSKFKIVVGTTSTNGTLTYTVTKPEDSIFTLTKTLTEGTLEFTAFGADVADIPFTIKVNDPLGLESSVFSFNVTYKNKDNVLPIAELFDLNTDIASGATSGTGSIHSDGGHIEPQGISIYDDNDPDVSGKIILRGKASDNQRLKEVSLTLGSSTFPILSWNGTEMAPLYWDATNSEWLTTTWRKDTDDVWKWMVWDKDHSEYIAVTVVNPKTSETLGMDKHEVYFTYEWDTSTVDGIYAVKNADVIITAVDAYYHPAGADPVADPEINGNVSDPATTSPKAGYTVDIMPYITKVYTYLSDLKSNNASVYNRTALGNYPVSTSDTTVAIEGYNLINTAGTATTAVLKDSDDNPVSLSVSGGKVQIPAASLALLASGELNLTVNGVPLLNNKNNNDFTTAGGAMPNRTPNGDNNDLLTDDVVLNIWNIKNSARSRSGTLTEPIMHIVPADDVASNKDVLRFAFTNGADHFSMAPGGTTATSYQNWQRNYADFINVAFAYDKEGNSYGIVTGLDTYPNGRSTYAGRFTFMTSRWGVCLPYVSTVETGNMNDNYYGYHKLRLESIGILNNTNVQGTNLGDDYIMDTKRFSSPSLATAVHSGTGDAASTSVYLAYYDKFQRQIRFRYGDFTSTTTNNPPDNKTFGTASDNLNSNKYFGQFKDQHAAPSVKNAVEHFLAIGTTQDARWAFDAAQSDYSLIAGKGTGNTAGKYVAIDVVPGTTADPDKVVAVWYDGKDLKYSYKVKPDTDYDAGSGTGDGYWSTAITIFTNGGKYCAIKVDSAGGIHIAAQDSVKQDLKYAYLKNYNNDGIEYVESTQSVVVDSYDMTGSQIKIDTQKEAYPKGQTATYVIVPYISYFNPAIAKPKMAYLVPQATMDYTLAGSDPISLQYTKNWEITIIPTEAEEVQDDYVNIGLWKTKDGVQRLNVQKPNTTIEDNLGENSGTSYGNGTNNPVVGYATIDGTQGYIETAQMK